MKFKDLISEMKGKATSLSEELGSSDDASSIKEEQSNYIQESIKILTTESFTSDQVVKSIRRLSSEKITLELVEAYKEVASSKELTNDKIVLNLRKEDTNKILGKYIFVLESGEIVAFSDLLILESMTEDELKEGSDVESLKKIVERKYG